MPIRFQYDAAAVVPPKQNELKKYGGPLVMQQRKYDMEQMQDRQQNDLRMGNVAAMQNFNRQPSIGEDDAMLEQEIRSGAYDPETVRALRDDQRAMRQIMRDRNIDGTQRAKALDNLRSRMRMSRSTGKVQPMMQQMPPAAIQGKPPMTEADYFSDPKNYSDSYATAQARLQEGNTPVTPDNVHAQMHNDYLAKQKFLQGLSQPQGQPQPNAPAGPQAPTAPAAAPAANPQASYSGGQPTFGASPVMAQGGMGASVGQGAYQPTGSYTSPEVFGAANVLAQQGQQAGQQPSLAGARKWTSIDGNYTTEGEFQGFAPGLSPDGSQIAMIKRSDTQKVVNVPLDRLSREDSMLLMTGGSRDTQYAMQNPQMSAGQAYFDPNNPVRQEMSAADQSMVNPQKQTLGQPGGRYGLGQIDYGINPATGNRVTASIRPGGTMPEYDEPIGPPGTAMGGGRGGLTIMGGRKKPAAAPEVSPGGTPVDAGVPPARMDRSSPEVQDALKVAADPNAADEQQIAAIATLRGVGFTSQDIKDVVLKAKPVAPSTAGQPAKKKLRDPIWGPVGDFLADPLGSANPLGPSNRSPNANPLQSTSAPSGGDWKKYSDSTRRSGEASPANPSLLDQLEQAEPSPTTPAPASNSPQSQGDLRTWTSVDGRTFEGTIVEGSLEAASRQEAGQQMVTVKRKDGQVFNIPIERLGEEDRAYLDALYKIRSAVNWTEGKDSRMGKGEAYQQNKPAGNSNKKPASKPKYIGETPKEVYQRPPSSSRGSAKRTG